MDADLDAFLKTTGWRRAASNGKSYYYNRGTNTTQWTLPPELKSPFEKYMASKKRGLDSSSTSSNKIAKKAPPPESDDEDDDFGEDEFDQQYAHDYDPNRDANYDDGKAEETAAEVVEMDNEAGDTQQSTDATEPTEPAEEETLDVIMADDTDYENLHTSATGEDTIPGLSMLPSPRDNKKEEEEEVPYEEVEVEATKVLTDEEKAELKEKTKEQLSRVLSLRDAVMDPGIIDVTNKYISLHDDDGAAAQEVIDSLSKGYVGYAQMSHIVSQWLRLAKHLNTQQAPQAENGKTSTTSTTTTATSIKTKGKTDSDINMTAIKASTTMLYSKFNQPLADELLQSSQSQPTWLTALMDDAPFRRTLIRLYNKHNDSTLLGYTLRQISSLGHHSDISMIIRDSEYFDVLNDLLIDIIVRLVFLPAEDEEALLSIVEDMKRISMSNEYVYFYSVHLLGYLELALLKESNSSTNNGNTMVLKIRKLRQLLEMSMIHGRNSTVPQSPLVPSTQKTLDRIAVFALSLGGVFTPKKAPLSCSSSSPSGDNTSTKESVVVRECLDILKSHIISNIHVERLCQYYFSTKVNLNTATAMDQEQLSSIIKNAFATASSDGSQGSVNVVYLRHPAVLHMLLRALISPKSIKKTSPAYSSWIARLIALAVTTDSSSSNYDTLMLGFCKELSLPLSTSSNDGGMDTRVRAVMSVSQDLQTISTLGSDVMSALHGAISYSKPAQLKAFISSDKPPVCSMAVLTWVMDSVTEKDYLRQGTVFLLRIPIFLDLILSVIDVSSVHYYDCYEVLKAVLTIDASDTIVDGETKKMDNNDNYSLLHVQKDTCDALLHLMSKGFVHLPMQLLISLASGFDVAIVRHLLHMIVTSFQPPFSSQFHSLVGRFFEEEAVIKTLASQHTDQQHKQAVTQFLSILSRGGEGEEDDDLF